MLNEVGEPYIGNPFGGTKVQCSQDRKICQCHQSCIADLGIASQIENFQLVQSAQVNKPGSDNCGVSFQVQLHQIRASMDDRFEIFSFQMARFKEEVSKEWESIGVEWKKTPRLEIEAVVHVEGSQVGALQQFLHLFLVKGNFLLLLSLPNSGDFQIH